MKPAPVNRIETFPALHDTWRIVLERAGTVDARWYRQGVEAALNGQPIAALAFPASPYGILYARGYQQALEVLARDPLLSYLAEKNKKSP